MVLPVFAKRTQGRLISSKSITTVNFSVLALPLAASMWFQLLENTKRDESRRRRERSQCVLIICEEKKMHLFYADHQVDTRLPGDGWMDSHVLPADNFACSGSQQFTLKKKNLKCETKCQSTIKHIQKMKYEIKSTQRYCKLVKS